MHRFKGPQTAKLIARLLLAGTWSAAPLSSAAPADQPLGPSVEQILELPEIAFAEFVSQARVELTAAENTVETGWVLPSVAASEPLHDSDGASASHSQPIAEIKGGIALDDLVGGEEVQFAALVQQAQASQLVYMDGSLDDGSLEEKAPAPLKNKAPKGIATTLPKSVKTSERTVRVEIPAEPFAEPIATRLSASSEATDSANKQPTQKQSISVKVFKELPSHASKEPSLAQLASPPPISGRKAATKDAMGKTSTPLTLTVQQGPTGLTLSPETLIFSKQGQSATIDLSGLKQSDVSLFVRDQTVVRFDVARSELTANKRGVTELYVVASGKMYIVPVSVDHSAVEWDLQIPDALVSLEGVFQEQAQASVVSARHPGAERFEAETPSLTDISDISDTSDISDIANNAEVAASSNNLALDDDDNGADAEGKPEDESANVSGVNAPKGPSLQDSLADVARTSLEDAREAQRFAGDQQSLKYKNITVQIIDERSQPSAGRIYPAAGAEVRIIGTEFVGKTDAAGHLTIRDVPADARLTFLVDDPNDAVRPAISELSTGSEDDQSVKRIRVLRTFTFETFASIAGSVQAAGYGSLCMTVLDHHNGNTKPVAGIAVGLDVAAEGPFYFNDYGFLDRSQHATGNDGRVCFFNALPGPAAASLFSGQDHMATLPVAISENRHLEQELDLADERQLQVRLAAMASAHVQLSRDERAANTFHTVDMIDLIPLGTDDPMEQLAPGHISSSYPLLPASDGRLRAFAQAAEFEPAIYTFASDERDQVVPLLPRGFIEDMSLYAQVAHDPALGSVVVEYGHVTGLEPGDAISMRLIDSEGRDAGTGWYFSDAPVTKAIFFNVPAGVYTLIVETRDGYWLTADTLFVYNETVSYQRLGNALRYRP